MINYAFLFATGAFGWGLSLATYRFYAKRNGWPMGALHVDLPFVPIAIGALAVVISLIYAILVGAGGGGIFMIAFGVALAAFWTGFLRVGSQTSLILAPVSAVLLLFTLASGSGLGYVTFTDYGDSREDGYSRASTIDRRSQ